MTTQAFVRYTTLSLVGILAIAQSSSAALLTPNLSAHSNTGVALMTTATTTEVDGSAKTLTLIGDGLRRKKVALIWVNVYVAQVLAELPVAFDRAPEKASDSIANVGTVAIQMNFLRNVDASTVQNSFKEAFTANGVNMTEAAIAGFLAAVNDGGDALSGTTMTIRGSKLANGSEEIVYEDSKGDLKTIVGSAGFIKKVFGIWYGTPADSGLVNLKAALLIAPTL